MERLDVHGRVRPHLRGVIHLVAAIASVIGLVALVVVASTPTALVAAIIYGLAGVLLYGVSSSYHLLAHSPQAQKVMRRIDHSMIFVLIAGTYTPVCLLALNGVGRWFLLAAVWAVALLGIFLKISALERFPKLGGTLYIAMGWLAILCLPALWSRPGILLLGGIGGLIYTAGAVLFFTQKPRGWPKWFGYHEVWHTLGVTAGVAFFIMNFDLISAA
ncbi:membrane protein [Actinomycetes bacterium]|nr:membrane protein [Actinomycetes bacterium]